MIAYSCSYVWAEGFYGLNQQGSSLTPNTILSPFKNEQMALVTHIEIKRLILFLNFQNY